MQQRRKSDIIAIVVAIIVLIGLIIWTILGHKYAEEKKVEEQQKQIEELQDQYNEDEKDRRTRNLPTRDPNLYSTVSMNYNIVRVPKYNMISENAVENGIHSYECKSASYKTDFILAEQELDKALTTMPAFDVFMYDTCVSLNGIQKDGQWSIWDTFNMPHYKIGIIADQTTQNIRYYVYEPGSGYINYIELLHGTMCQELRQTLVDWCTQILGYEDTAIGPALAYSPFSDYTVNPKANVLPSFQWLYVNNDFVNIKLFSKSCLGVINIQPAEGESHADVAISMLGAYTYLIRAHRGDLIEFFGSGEIMYYDNDDPGNLVELIQISDPNTEFAFEDQQALMTALSVNELPYYYPTEDSNGTYIKHSGVQDVTTIKEEEATVIDYGEYYDENDNYIGPDNTTSSNTVPSD